MPLVVSASDSHPRAERFRKQPNSPLTLVVAGEAIIGLLIEITFIATFTQRFFAR